MDKSKPIEPQPSHDELVERLEALENRLEKLQDYTVLNIRDLYESDLDQKRAILNTQHVMLGDLKQRGIWKEPEEPKEYQAPSLEESIQRMTKEEIIDAVDGLLYRAKDEGKRRFASPEWIVPLHLTEREE